MFSRRLLSSCKVKPAINQLLQQQYAQSAQSTQTEPSRIEKTVNQVTLLGRVGADPQRKGNDSHPVAVFSLATHSNYRYDNGDFMQRVDWHRVCVFKPNLREAVLNYLKKGQRVHVTGRLTYGDIRGDDGASKAVTSVVADDVIFFQGPDNNK